MNRKKNDLSNNLTILKTQFSIENIENSMYLAYIFEMHNLYIMWLYPLRFVTCKDSLDTFNLLYSKLLHAKLSLFVFVATFAESHWQVISVYSCFICD